LNNGKDPVPFSIVPDKTQCVLNHCTGRRKKVDDQDTLSIFCSRHAEFFLTLMDMLPNLMFIVEGQPMKVAFLPITNTPADKGPDLWTPGNPT